jgi:putative transposase
LIERDEYLLACGLYIERNPVRAKIVNSAESYKYSSCSVYTKGEEDGITDKDPFYEGLGETAKFRQERYQSLMLDREKGLTERIFNQLYLGTEKFIKEMEEKFKKKNIRGERGRPKK